jgi:Cu(I)/Ag(I) efflux system protein CusF
MKTSMFVISIAIVFSMFALPGYAMDDMKMSPSKATAKQQPIEGKGVVVSVNKNAGNVTLKHEPISAIGWSGMTMNFKVKDKMLLDKTKKGDKVKFTLVPEGQDYVITSIK